MEESKHKLDKMKVCFRLDLVRHLKGFTKHASKFAMSSHIRPSILSNIVKLYFQVLYLILVCEDLILLAVEEVSILPWNFQIMYSIDLSISASYLFSYDLSLNFELAISLSAQILKYVVFLGIADNRQV